MALIIDGNEVIKTEGYAKDRSRRRYWQTSFDCYGPDYINSTDGEGNPIIRQHEREDDSDYSRRLATAVPLQLVGPVIRRYNDFVFRKDAVYDEDAFGELYKDIDGHGNSVAVFMRKRLLDAQNHGVSYVRADSNVSTAGKTMAQANAANDRVLWRPVHADKVIQWRYYNGELIEAATLECDEFGQDYVLWADNVNSQRVDVSVTSSNAGMIIKVIEQGPIEAHGWMGNPLVPLHPEFGDRLSQAAGMSELQKSVARLRTLLDEEIQNSTYSQTFLFGVSAQQMNGEMKTGNKQAICVPDSAARVDTVGGDPAQADSIRRSIDEDRRELYRTAGIDADAGQEGGQVESGVAKAFKFNDLAANLKALATATEKTHRRLEALTADAMGISEYAAVKYPDDFNMPIFEKEMREAIEANSSRLPRIITDKIIQRFAQRNVELDDSDKLTLEQQLDDAGVSPVTLT